MRCEENIQALIDAAALGQAPESSVAEHMRDCPQCRASFQREQQLFAAIDSALHTRLSKSPRPGFLARASARLSKEPINNSAVNPGWAAVAVLAVAFLALAHPWITSQLTAITENPGTSVARAQQNISSSASASDANAWNTNQRSTIARARKGSNQRFEIKGATPREPDVLVPPDEQKAFAQFVARVAGQDAMAAAVVSRAPDKTMPGNAVLPPVPSVDLAQLERVERDDLLDEIDGSE